MISEPSIAPLSRSSGRGITLSLGAYWHRIALLGVVILAAVLNFVGLSREGYSNEYYAAAVKSMSESWHNFFYNSFDPGGFVTIDKPPLGFWFQVASVKVFGFSGVALLIPQALAGVLSVALLYVLVARSFGRTAGLLAALALAMTPISVVTNRNNTIDSTLVLFVLLAAWAVLRAAETGRLRWLLLSAVFVGLGFNIKMLQAYLVVPALGAVYLLGARLSLWRRLAHLGLATIVLLAVSLAWVIAVDLTPSSQRPWVDSTTTNSALDLAIGYNGLQRLTGNRAVSGPGSSARTSPTDSTGAQGVGTGTQRAFGGGSGPGGNGGPGGIGENGPTGVLRLLDTQLGSQIGWLLPLAVLGLVVAAWQTRPRLRLLDERQRSLVLWGVWLLTTGAFFSVALFFHTYYLVMTAPAVSALAGVGVVSLWRAFRQPDLKTWWLLPLCLLITAGVEAHILADYASWARWLTPIVVGGCVLAGIALIVVRLGLLRHRLAAISAAVAVATLLTPSATWAAYTAQNTQTGSILRAGPSAGNGQGVGQFSGRFGAPPTGSGSGNPPGESFGPPPGAQGNGASPPPGGSGAPGGTGVPRFNGRMSAGNVGGGPGRERVSTALVTYLTKHRGSAKYLVATANSSSAAPIIIATGLPVMSLGGFSGSDPILTTSQLASLAKQGVVRYFLIGGGPGFGGSGLTSWIQQHSTTVTVGGTQLYKYTG